MGMDSGTLYIAIAEVCPVISTSVPDPDNRQTWTWEPDGSASQAQIDAGNNVIQTIAMEPLGIVKTPDFIQRFTDAEYLLLKQKYETEITGGDASSARRWDTILAADQVDMNTGNAQSLKADMVADGILSQERADEIFS